MFTWRALPALAAFAIVALSSAGQETGSVCVTVLDANGRALSGATLRITPPVFVVSAPQTNAAGLYCFDAVPPGSYRIEATMSGFHDVTRVAVVAARKQTRLEIRLPTATIADAFTITSAEPKGSDGYSFFGERKETQGQTMLSFASAGRRKFSDEAPLALDTILEPSLTRSALGWEMDRVRTGLDPQTTEYFAQNFSRSDIVRSIATATESNHLLLDRDVEASLRVEYLAVEQQLRREGQSTDQLERVAPFVLSAYLSQVTHGQAAQSYAAQLLQAIGHTVGAAFSLMPTTVSIAFAVSPDGADYRVTFDGTVQRCSKLTPCVAVAGSGFHSVDVQVEQSRNRCHDWLVVVNRDSTYYCPKK
jgi:Carboxypeptidase regulatory-like domain